MNESKSALPASDLFDYLVYLVPGKLRLQGIAGFALMTTNSFSRIRVAELPFGHIFAPHS
jgi:hypothetical protein